MKKILAIFFAFLLFGQLNSIFAYSPPSPIPNDWEEQFTSSKIQTSGVGVEFQTDDYGDDFSTNANALVVHSSGQYNNSAKYRVYIKSYDTFAGFDKVAGGDIKYSEGHRLIEFKKINFYCTLSKNYGKELNL